MIARWLAGLFIAAAIVQPAAADPWADVTDAAAKAEANLWFGLNDQGNLADFDLARQRLDEAEAHLADVPEGAERDAILVVLGSLRADLREVEGVYDDKLAANLPLFRFMGPPLLVAPGALHSFELIDDPRETAANQAVNAILAPGDWVVQRRAQIDVVFAAQPADAGLEREALAAFNRDPRYFVHTEREVATALLELDPTGQLVDKASQGEITNEAATALNKAFGSDRFLFVILRRQPSEEGSHFYIAEASVVSNEGVVQRAQAMGFGRDRRDQMPTILAAHGIFFSLALLFHLFRRGLGAGLKEYLAPLFAFALGRVAPWGVAAALGAVKPANDTLLVLGFWWPLVAGMASLILPLVLLATLGRRLPVIATYLSLGRGLQTLTICAALGLAAWWATPLLVWGAQEPLYLLAASAVGLVAAGALLGGGKANKLWRLPAGVLGLGALVLATTATEFEIAAGIAAGLLLLAAINEIPSRQRRSQEDTTPPTDTVLRPAYRPFRILSKLQERAAPLNQAKTAWVLLAGPAGSGKSSHARALLAKLEEGSPPLAVLEGACEDLAGAGAIPYGPFQRAIAQHLSLDLAASGRPESDMETGVYQLLLGPLAPLFQGAAGPSASASDLNHFIAREIRRLGQRRRLVIMIESAQWLDEASHALLKHLRETFPPGGSLSLLVLLVVRSAEADALARDLALGDARLDLAPLSATEERELLTVGCRLSDKVADWVLSWLGVAKGGGQPADLVAVVEDLKRAGCLEEGPAGLVFAATFDVTRPPLSNSALEEVKKTLAIQPEAKEILAVAGCLGQRFEAQMLSDALSLPRGETLRRLEAIEAATGLVRDVREEDDLYEFRSQRVLDALRDQLQLHLMGPRATSVPQGVREIHAQIARVLQARQGEGLADLMRAANHFHAAGRRYAKEAIESNLAAAERLARLLRFDEAKRHLDQAADYAPFLRREGDIERARLLQEAERAHVTGSGARAVAEQGLARLAKGEGDHRLILAAARACYEAGRDGGPSLAAEAERLGLEAARASDPLIAAEGLHFAGLAYRFDEARKGESLERLRKALKAAEAIGSEGAWLLARIANSLALVESDRGPEGRKEAERLIRLSLEIKQRQEIPDLPGLARSYGTLGFLLLDSGDRSRLQEAEEAFWKDLEIAREIGDRAGEAKAQLWLGQCHVEQSEWDEASKAFDEVERLKATPGDIATAQAGRLRIHRGKGERGAYLALVEKLVGAPVPRESRESLKQALAWNDVADVGAVIKLKAALEAS